MAAAIRGASRQRCGSCLAATRFVAPWRVVPAAPRRPVVLLPLALALHTFGRGAQRVIPILRPSWGALPHDGLDARGRLLHLLPHLIAAGVVVEVRRTNTPPALPPDGDDPKSSIGTGRPLIGA